MNSFTETQTYSLLERNLVGEGYMVWFLLDKHSVTHGFGSEEQFLATLRSSWAAA